MSFLLGKLGLGLALVAVCLVSLAVIARNWHPTPSPRVERLGPYSVASVATGATLDVFKGIRDRRRETVTLDWITAPSTTFADESAANLKAIIQPPAKIWVEVQTTRRIGRPELCGEVFSESGACCNLEQVKAGLAWCHTDAPKAYKQAEEKARHEKNGLWAGKTVRCDQCTGKTCWACGGSGELVEYPAIQREGNIPEQESDGKQE